MESDSDLIVDNSTLRAVATCSTRALVEMALGWQAQEEVAPLELGRAVHAALAAWLESKGSVGKGMVVFEAEYRTWAETNLPTTDQRSWKSTEPILRAWFRKNPFEDLPYEIKMVEAGFHFPLAPGIRFVGLLDGLGQSKADASWRVIEHKTTGSLTAWWAAQWHVDSQITGYLWGAAKVLGEPVVAAYINGIEFPKPYLSDRTCKTHGTGYQECGPLHARGEVISTQRTEGQIADWRRSAIRLAKRYASLKGSVVGAETWMEQAPIIQKTPQEGTFTSACRFCQFAEFCKTGRRHRGMLVQRPWNPMERAEAEPVVVE